MGWVGGGREYARKGLELRGWGEFQPYKYFSAAYSTPSLSTNSFLLKI